MSYELSRETKAIIKCFGCAYEEIEECTPNTKSCNGLIMLDDIIFKSTYRKMATINRSDNHSHNENVQAMIIYDDIRSDCNN